MADTVVQVDATVEATGGNTTGIRLPDDVLAQLGAGKRPKVTVTLGTGYAFRTSIGTHDGSPFIPVSAAVRKEAGIAAGDAVVVGVALDTAPREVEMPDDLAAAMAEQPESRTFFDTLTDSQRKQFVESVTSAKKPETRSKRIGAAVAALVERRKRP